MSIHQKIPTFPTSHWNELFTLLSLDGVDDLYVYFGLDFCGKQALRDSVRACIELARLDRDVLEAKKPSQEVLLPCLQKKLGEEVFSKFLHWASLAYLGGHEVQRGSSAWDWVLGAWFSAKEWPTDVAAGDMKWMTEMLRSLGMEHYAIWESEVAAIKQRYLSEWNVDMYNRNEWNHFDGIKDPFISLSLLITVQNTQKTLKAASEKLSPETLERLRDAGQKVLDELRSGREDVEGLEASEPELLLDIPTLVSRL